MADPVSLVASVLTIAAAASQISKAISRLRAFGEVPVRVYTVKNEVSDLEVVLRHVGHALEQETLAAETAQALQQTLTRTREHLHDLAKGLERIADACNGGKIKMIKKSHIWAREKELFQKLQEDIHSVKATLTLMVGVSNSSDIQRIFLELRQVNILTTSSSATQKSITQSFHDHTDHMDQQYEGLTKRLDALGQLVLSGQQIAAQGSGAPPMPSDHEGNEVAKASSLRVLISQRTPCRDWCPCSCHVKQSKKMTVPGIMESLLGTMFVGYTGIPVLGKPCDFRGCTHHQSLAATIEYWFPWWFVSKNLKVQFSYLPNIGPQLQLATMRRVTDTALSVTYATQGNIDGLKTLFSEGLASPRDVSNSRGFTLLRWALYGGMHQYDTVKFLLAQGAQVDEESYDHVWDFSFRGKCNETEQQELRCITQAGEQNWLEDQNFPLVHRIVFGLSPKSLAAELAENPHAIYLKDAQGRTALDWATARAQLDDMRLLIAHGADVNTMDTTGRTTVLHAVDSHSDETLRIILEAGGNPNPKMPKGVFRSSPLTSSGFGGLAGMLRLLLKHGAEPDACNPEGRTALHSVAATQNVECALILLEWGADLNVVSSNGRTPLTTAIIHNNHAVLRLFVDRCYEYITTARLKGPQLLPIIAEHADIETISILASSHPLKLSLDLSLDRFTSSREVLQSRRDYNDKLAAAFEELVTVAHAEEAEAGSNTDSALESGLFFSAKSSFHSDLGDALAKLNSLKGTPAEGSVDDGSDRSTSPVQGATEAWQGGEPSTTIGYGEEDRTPMIPG